MSKDINWLEKKYFILGYKNISAKTLLKTFNGMNGKFLTQQLNRELLNYWPRGEQMTRILKEFTKRGFLTQENTMEGFDGKGAKRARYIYEVIE